MTEEEKLSRRERRAAEKGKTDDAEPKDRNARVRAAAPGRKARERERASAAAEGLSAGARVDDALVRGADKTSRFVRSQFPWLQWVILALFAGLIALLIYNFRQDRRREKLGDLLAEVLSVAQGRLATSAPAQPSDRNLVDTRPEFADASARTQASLGAWKGLAESASGELSAYATLARAATLLDEKKWTAAREAFERAAGVRGVPAEVTLRAREGVGLAYEGEGLFAEARGAYEKLKDVQAPQAGELARFHQARVRFLLGEKDAAKEELTKLRAELGKATGLSSERGYLSLAVDDLLKTVDPNGVPPTSQLEELRKQLEAMQKAGLPVAPLDESGTTP